MVTGSSPPGQFPGRTDHGDLYLVTNAATHDLGNDQLAQRLWVATDPEADGEEVIEAA